MRSARTPVPGLLDHVHVDGLGTLVSNIAGNMVAGAGAVQVEGKVVGPLQRTCAAVAQDEPVA